MGHLYKSKDEENRLKKEHIRLENLSESIKQENTLIRENLVEEKSKIKEERLKLYREKVEQGNIEKLKK